MSVYAIQSKYVRTTEGESIVRLTVLKRAGMVWRYTYTINNYYIRPAKYIEDYREHYTGVTEEFLDEHGVRHEQVKNVLKDISVPENLIIGINIADTYRFMGLHENNTLDVGLYLNDGKYVTLNYLTREFFNYAVVVDGEHDADVDVKAIMTLYEDVIVPYIH